MALTHRTRWRFNADIWRFLIYWGLVSFGYFGVQGVLLNLYLRRLGYGPGFIGPFLATGQLVWAVAALLSIPLARRIGLRRAMVAGVILITLGISLLLCVEWLPRAWWSVWLYLWWSVLWIGAAPHTVNAAPYVMGVADEETRGSAFSAQQAAIALMAFAGAVLAGLLASALTRRLNLPADDPAPYRLALCLAPIAYLLAAVVIAGAREVFPAPQPVVDAPGARRPWGFFVFFGVVVFLLTAAENGVRAMYNLYLDTDLGITSSMIGATYGVAQLLAVLAALATPLLLNRWGTGYTLSATALVMAVCIVPIAAIPTLIAAALGYAGVAMLANMNGPARRLFSQQEVAPAWQITTAAIGTMTLALGWAASAALSGYVIETAGFSFSFYLSAGLALAAGLLFWIYTRHAHN